MRFLLLFLLALLGGAVPAHADIAATYRQIGGEGTWTIEVAENGDARLQVSDQNWHLLIVGGEAHVVYHLPQGMMVTRVADLETLMAERGIDYEPPALSGVSFVERGQTSIGGNRGTAYHLRTPHGDSSRPVLVISRDPALAPLQRPLLRQMDFSIATMRIAGSQPPENFMILRRLVASGAPLLFLGHSLERLDRTAIDPRRLRLPGPPVSLVQLRANAAAQQQR